MSTINVGSGRSIKDLATAVASAKAADTIALDAGICTGPIMLNGVSLVAADPAHPPTITASGLHPYAAAVQVRGSNVRLADLIIAANGCEDLDVSGSVGCRMSNIQLNGNLWGLDCGGATDLLWTGGSISLKSGYGIYLHTNGTAKTPGKGIGIEAVTVAGSTGQHAFRMDGQQGVTVRRCKLTSGSQRGVPSMDIRANCSDVLAEDCDFDQGFGLGAKWNDGNSTSEIDTRITIRNCRSTGGYVALFEGLTDLLIDGLTIAADAGGAVFNTIRPPVTGIIRNVTATYANGQLVNGPVPPGVTMAGITFNGKLVIPAAPTPTPPIPPTIADVAKATGLTADALALLKQWIAQ